MNFDIFLLSSFCFVNLQSVIQFCSSHNLLLYKPCQVLSAAAVLIGAWEGKLAAALILPEASLFNVHHDGERERKKGTRRVGWAG